MREIALLCPARALVVPMRDVAGRELGVVLAKVTFAVDAHGRVELAERPAEPRLVDEMWGEDPLGSLRKPSELCWEKPGTEVFLVGHAHPPRGRASHVDVRLAFGPIDKTLRVHGTRAWQAVDRGRLLPGPARPLTEPVPLRWELAFGGTDLTDPERPLVEPRNPIGRGVARDPSSLVGQRASQIDALDAPAGSEAPLPACFAPIHRHWQPRAAFAGTFDAAWERTKMPLLPDDFDVRFHLSAPRDQWSATPLRGDETATIVGATPEGVWRFQLPRVPLGISVVVSGQERSLRVALDTILVDADAGRVELVFRSSFPMPRKYELVEAIRIVEKGLVAPAA